MEKSGKGKGAQRFKWVEGSERGERKGDRK